MAWLDVAPGVLAYTRGPGFACVLNMSDVAVALPDHDRCLLTSSPLDGDLLPRDTAVWLRREPVVAPAAHRQQELIEA